MEGRAGAGALGPRLAGRLTAELILRSPQYMSCVKDYEIDLRGMLWLASEVNLKQMELQSAKITCDAGHKLSAIENLGATEVCRALAYWTVLWLAQGPPICTCQDLDEAQPLCSMKQPVPKEICRSCLAISAEPV